MLLCAPTMGFANIMRATSPQIPVVCVIRRGRVTEAIRLQFERDKRIGVSVDCDCGYHLVRRIAQPETL